MNLKLTHHLPGEPIKADPARAVLVGKMDNILSWDVAFPTERKGKIVSLDDPCYGYSIAGKGGDFWYAELPDTLADIRIKE